MVWPDAAKCHQQPARRAGRYAPRSSARDFNDCGNPCVNIGGRDGWFLEALLDRAMQAAGWSTLNVAKVCVMQAPPLYHTTGEVLDVISTPGLERIARFLAFFVSAVEHAPRERINP